MTVEPIRSALANSSSEDTSLVLPSDKNHRTGQQRVLEQVNTIKRRQLKKSDSSVSPASPISVTDHSERKFMFSPTKQNFNFFNGLDASKSQSRMTGRTLSLRNSMKSQTIANIQSTSNGVSASKFKQRSISLRYNNYTSQKATGQVNNKMTSTSLTKLASTKPPSNQSQTLKNVATAKSKSDLSGKASSANEVAMSSISLQEAVEYLTHSNVNHQMCGASYIQHHTFTEDSVKQEVCRLGGIPSLVQLLNSDNSQLQPIAAAALRNLVFKDSENKLAVEKCGGLEVVLNSLRNTNDIETQKQLSGLLWNLSSADTLKPELIKNALPLLTESVLVPFTSSNTSKHIEPEVFYNTTGCLRNLSCANAGERISMRNCSQLIDSLVAYVQAQVEREEPDEKSVENCICILHNLSYQLEKEAPEHFKQFAEPDGVSQPEDTSKKSIFKSKNSKKQKDFPEMERPDCSGTGWLYHIKTLQLYLSLLGCSLNESTQEACCGAMQNLTASKTTVSAMMSQTIVKKLQGLTVISPLLRSQNAGLQKATLSLVGNMCRVSSLRAAMAKDVLPEVSGVLSADAPNVQKDDSIIASACRVMHTLLLAEPGMGKKVLNRNLVDRLSALNSSVSLNSARDAAGALLWSLWGQKDLQNALKKQGMNKEMFVNGNTVTSYERATGSNGQ